MANEFIFRGMFAHSTDDDPLVIFPDHVVGVRNGKIIFFNNAKELDRLLKDSCLNGIPVIHLQRGQFIIPGFIDTHIHAPQYPNCGKGLDVELQAWLEKYTFPTEAKFKDACFAEHVYEKAVKRILRNGTTTACYQGSIHTDSCLKLCDIIEKYGQRALIGKVNMNINSPANYTESREESLKETERFVDILSNRAHPLLNPVVTPRNALSCDSQLMTSLGKLARDRNLHIQTHISETRDQLERMRNLFPDHQHYVDVYDKAGLLGKKTILAHGIFLSPEERHIIKLRGCGISHCPNSNISIHSGLCDVKAFLDENINVGLGTDCSAGYSTSIQDSMRCSLHTSNILAMSTDKKPITHRETFMMATLGGAKVLDLADTIGNFVVGKRFDALVVDTTNDYSQIDIFEDDTLHDVFQKFIYLGNEQNFTHIYVDGQNVIEILQDKPTSQYQ